MERLTDRVTISFTGTREGMTPDQYIGVIKVIQGLRTETKRDHECFLASAHHGDCVGADEQFHQICALFHIPVVLHPPDIREFRAFCRALRSRETKPYLDRNRDIVDDGHILIAAPKGKEDQRSGTWATIRYARSRGRKIFLVKPNGKVVVEKAKRLEATAD